MTVEAILDGLIFNQITSNQAKDLLSDPRNRKILNYFIHRNTISQEPLSDSELAQLNAIVEILQILYNSECDSPVSDADYETLQEMLIDAGIPRLTSDVRINDADKVQHRYTNLRGTLDKVHYLTRDERRTNPSRKYLDDWIKSTEAKYEKATGKKINLNECRVLVQGKFDGVSCVLEIDEKGNKTWLTRGDTERNMANDVSRVMKRFNDLYTDEGVCGIKFEIMVTEESRQRINELYKDRQYKNSRQIVSATLNSETVDYKAEFLYPVPLRKMTPGDDVEQIHPNLIRDFPTLECKLGERERIREFALKNKLMTTSAGSFRVDGVVITILDPDVQRALGRENSINNFEVALKFTEESAITTVKDVEFAVSPFGFVTPILVVEDVVLKGNTINHISLSNRERFDELGLCYGDQVVVLYDIIPYATIDPRCRRSGRRRIEFPRHCPRCGSELDLKPIQVQCQNKDCPSKILGRIINWCENLRIHNIGSQTLETLQSYGFLDRGILSLYKLKNKRLEIEEIPGFGQLSTRRIIAEIESKRRLKDYEIFGSLGIGSLSIKTFQTIFSAIPYQTFMGIVGDRKWDDLRNRLVNIPGMGEKRSEILLEWIKDPANRKDLNKLLGELTIVPTFGSSGSLGQIVFTGFRDKYLAEDLEKHGWEVGESLTKRTKYLVVENDGVSTTKTQRAKDLGIPIITKAYLLSNINNLK